MFELVRRFGRWCLEALRCRCGVIPDGPLDARMHQELNDDGWRDVLGRAFCMVPAIVSGRAGRLRYYEQVRHTAVLNQGTWRELRDYILSPEGWIRRLNALNSRVSFRVRQHRSGFTLFNTGASRNPRET
jgi:hypothetical protein